MEVVKWLNENSGFIMALLTFVYVIATVLICIFNYKSAKATRDQTNESNKQFIENNRAHIVPKIVELEGEMLCLEFENIGNNIAKNVIINVEENWLKKLAQTKTFPEVAERLEKLKNNKLFLTVQQKILYGLCIPGNGYDDFQVLGEENLKIEISYDTLNNKYKEIFEIPLSAYDYMVNQSDYARLTKKQIKETKNIKEQLVNINKSLKNIADINITK